MNCLECRGACCESILIPRFPGDGFIVAENNRWLELHGTPSGTNVSLEARCTALGDDGLCTIYEDRPLPCVVYPPGEEACLATIRERRTRQDYERIRDAGDPPIEAVFGFEV